VNGKALIVGALRMVVRLSAPARRGWARAWAHACLSEAIGQPVHPSVVVLGPVEVHGTAQITLGKELYLYRELYFETQRQGRIDIGDAVVLSRGVHVVSFGAITIGEGTMIGEYTSLRDANHRTGEGSLRDSGHESEPIVIGRHVWIGRGVTILPGVTIGDHAVIGANAVVTRSVPAGAVAVGIPARARPKAAA
jgi:acetyltransferase-like isoleucine patch superfamily enzyme